MTKLLFIISGPADREWGWGGWWSLAAAVTMRKG